MKKCGVGTITIDTNSMKKLTIFLMILFAFMIHSNAQIPNNGFEQWDNIGSFMEPVGYLTPNSEAVGTYYPITRSADHFPTDVGDYSMRMENNISLLPDIDGFGVALQNTSNFLFDGPGPSFPVTGHPTSLTGYYKFAPQNGDTMRIQIFLSNQGAVVMNQSFISTDTVISWASFTIPFSNYTTADSGSIIISSYNADGYPPEFAPRGNSVLYVDNLNFDNLITSLPEQHEKNNLFNIFPNPALDYISLEINEAINNEPTLNIYNLIGERVLTEKLKQNNQIVNIEKFNSGIYIIEIKANDLFEKQKLIIQ